MSQAATKITLICEPNVEAEIETALENSGFKFTKEEVKEPIEAHIFYIPNLIPAISVALHILEAKKDFIKGNIELPNGTKCELTQEGIAKLNGLLIEAMCKKKEETVPTQIAWWTPFIPQIQEGLNAIIEFIRWYPKAMGKGKRDVTMVFVALLGAIVLGMGFLTYVGKVNGESFVFVVGALVGYIFAFLQKFLGILSG